MWARVQSSKSYDEALWIIQDYVEVTGDDEEEINIEM